jgi:hypothetical protein
MTNLFGGKVDLANASLVHSSLYLPQASRLLLMNKGLGSDLRGQSWGLCLGKAHRRSLHCATLCRKSLPRKSIHTEIPPLRSPEFLSGLVALAN